MNIMHFTKTVMENLFSKPATRPYPQQPRVYPQRTRGKIGIDIEICVFCGLCSKKCPTGAIAVNRTEKSWSIERFGCIQCGYCIESCPKKCLNMLQDYPQPTAQKSTDCYSQPLPPPEQENSTEGKELL